MVNNVPKAKRGIAIALSLPANDSSEIREQVFEEISIDDLRKETGLKALLDFMDLKLGKDIVVLAYPTKRRLTTGNSCIDLSLMQRDVLFRIPSQNLKRI